MHVQFGIEVVTEVDDGYGDFSEKNLTGAIGPVHRLYVPPCAFRRCLAPVRAQIHIVFAPWRQFPETGLRTADPPVAFAA